MKDYVLISVVIPVYNVEAFLCEAVDSAVTACDQLNGERCEIILVDDGSTDNCGRICDEYEKKYSSIIVIHQKNGGLSAARNAGLNAARGEYIYFLDSDDYIKPETLSLTVQLAEKENADVVFFDGYVFFTDCEPNPNVYTYARKQHYETAQGKELLLKLLETDEYRTAVPLMLFRISYLKKRELVFENGILHEDELFTGLVYLSDGVFAHCNMQLYGRRVRQGSIMTATSAQKHYDSMVYIFQKYVSMLNSGVISGETAQKYTLRQAKSVIAKYKKLDLDGQKRNKQSYRDFQRTVIRNNGFGEDKIKIKCSSGISKFLFKVQWKIVRLCNVKGGKV